MERGTVIDKLFAQEHNAVSPARAQTQTALSGGEHTKRQRYHRASTRVEQVLVKERSFQLKVPNWLRALLSV